MHNFILPACMAAHVLTRLSASMTNKLPSISGLGLAPACRRRPTATDDNRQRPITTDDDRVTSCTIRSQRLHLHVLVLGRGHVHQSQIVILRLPSFQILYAYI
jgi:hypothetical protein